MFPRAAAAVLTLFVPAAAQAEPRAVADESWLRGMEFGLWCMPQEPDDVSDSPGTIVGTTDRYDRMPNLVVRTQTVPLADEVTFGVRAQFKRSSWRDLPLKAVLVHPSPEGGVPEIETWEVWPFDDGSFFNTYTLLGQPESDVGRWTFILSDGRNRLHEVEFLVVPPETAPDLVDVCNEAQVS